MNTSVRLVAVASALGVFGLVVGCDWEDSDDFNTARGAGANVNFSGTYDGTLPGAWAVSRLVVTQVGNSIQVWDNNNSQYTGTIGAPGVVASADSDGNFPTGAVMLQAQVNFSGRNLATQREITFVGILRAVAVTDVTSSTTTTESETTTTNAVTGEVETETTSVTRTWTLDNGNTQYLLEGNWVEGGSTVQVNASSMGSAGTIVNSTATVAP